MLRKIAAAVTAFTFQMFLASCGSTPPTPGFPPSIPSPVGTWNGTLLNKTAKQTAHATLTLPKFNRETGSFGAIFLLNGGRLFGSGVLDGIVNTDQSCTFTITPEASGAPVINGKGRLDAGKFSGIFVIDRFRNIPSQKGRFSFTKESNTYDQKSTLDALKKRKIVEDNILNPAPKYQRRKISRQAASIPQRSHRSYSPSSKGRMTIKENVGSGSVITMTNGTVWKIDPYNKIDAMLWMSFDDVIVTSSNRGGVGYNYLLINPSDKEQAHAKRIR